jgi:hypothetical protein
LTSQADFERLHREFSVGTASHAANEVNGILAGVGPGEAPLPTTAVLEDTSSKRWVGATVVRPTESPDVASAAYIEAIGTPPAYRGCLLANGVTKLSGALLYTALEVVSVTTASKVLPVTTARVRLENKLSQRMFTVGGFEHDGRVIRVRESDRLSPFADPQAYIGLEEAAP